MEGCHLITPCIAHRCHLARPLAQDRLVSAPAALSRRLGVASVQCRGEDHCREPRKAGHDVMRTRQLAGEIGEAGGAPRLALFCFYYWSALYSLEPLTQKYEPHYRASGQRKAPLFFVSWWASGGSCAGTCTHDPTATKSSLESVMPDVADAWQPYSVCCNLTWFKYSIPDEPNCILEKKV